LRLASKGVPCYSVITKIGLEKTRNAQGIVYSRATFASGGRPAAPRDLPPAKLPAILEGCAWMRHCRDDAATLPEPEWYRMLTVIARCEDAERWAHELSKPYPNYSRAETEKKLRQASREGIGPVTCAYVEAELGGDQYCSACLFRGNLNSPITIGRLDSADGEAEEPAPAVSKIERFTDLGNARRFVARYRDRARYCERWAKWFVWDGMRWKEDETLEVFELATRLIRSLYALARRINDADKRKVFLNHLVKSESWRSISAMLNLAKSDPSVAIRPGDLDPDPWLLTVKNGTLDLRTGQLRPHDPRDLISKLAPVEYDPRAECPNWMEFLYMVMNRRRSLVEFLQRAFGTCLTGITSDKAMFILYGAAGDNGKSTMIDVFQSLLGDYASRTPVETFLRRKEGTIPNDVARLKGARFVWASENEHGTRLSEALIKEMTGGDRMSARFMRGEFFEFYPEFKPWLATNHKPQIRGDQPLWRRLKLIPFDVSISKEIQRPRHEVMAMFRAEFPGILNWAVQGCLEWQRDGLGVPQEVVEATRGYEAERVNEQRLARLEAAGLIARVVRHPKGHINRAILFRRPGEGGAVQLRQYMGTRYSFREHLDNGRLCWKLRRLGRGNELRSIFLTVVAECMASQ